MLLLGLRAGGRSGGVGGCSSSLLHPSPAPTVPELLEPITEELITLDETVAFEFVTFVEAMLLRFDVILEPVELTVFVPEYMGSLAELIDSTVLQDRPRDRGKINGGSSLSPSLTLLSSPLVRLFDKSVGFVVRSTSILKLFLAAVSSLLIRLLQFLGLMAGGFPPILTSPSDVLFRQSPLLFICFLYAFSKTCQTLLFVP